MSGVPSPHSTQELTQAVRDAVKMQHYTPLNDALARIEEQLHAADEFKAAMVRANQRQVDQITSLREQLEASKAEVRRLQDFCWRADEQARLIAEASGADGTSPDDWRAVHAKWDVALNEVRQLRADYDEAIGVSSPATSPKERVKAATNRLRELGESYPDVPDPASERP